MGFLRTKLMPEVGYRDILDYFDRLNEYMATSPEDCLEIKHQIFDIKNVVFDIWSQPNAGDIADQIYKDYKDPIDSYFDQMNS